MSDIEILEGIKELNVLYVEDDLFQMQQTLSILSIFFKNIKTVDDGTKALQEFEKNFYHLVISDVMLPTLSGTQLAQKIRAQNENVHIILISCNVETAYLKKAIQLQALDYLVKPYSFEDLKNVLLLFGKKALQDSAKCIIINQNISYDTTKCCAVVNEIEITLTKKEQKLLQLAGKLKNKVLTYAQINETLYMYEADTNSSSIKNVVFRLRKKLGYDVFVNIPEVGYRVIS